MGEMGHCRELVPGVRAMGTRASVWRRNPDRALRVALWSSLYPGLPGLNSLPWGALQLCFWDPTLPSASRSLGLLMCAVYSVGLRVPEGEGIGMPKVGLAGGRSSSNGTPGRGPKAPGYCFCWRGWGGPSLPNPVTIP